MEEARRVDDIEAAVVALQPRVGRVQHVARHEPRGKPAAVAEQLVAEVDELRPQVRPP
jgi:hypothetical protein